VAVEVGAVTTVVVLLAIEVVFPGVVSVFVTVSAGCVTVVVRVMIAVGVVAVVSVAGSPWLLALEAALDAACFACWTTVLASPEPQALTLQASAAPATRAENTATTNRGVDRLIHDRCSGVPGFSASPRMGDASGYPLLALVRRASPLPRSAIIRSAASSSKRESASSS